MSTSRRIVAMLGLLTGVAARLASAEAPDLAAIDALVNEERAAQHIPGLALGIVQRDRIVHAAGFGAADDAGRPVDADTPFFLGSTTKSFTALALMQLVESGRVRLDAPVREYVPWFRVADEHASGAITVRDLLNQTSGLSSATGRLTLTDFASGDDAIENRVRLLAHVALTAPVGARFQYSNANYQVLGLIVQRASGSSYESYAAEHIFAPLAMTHTFTAKEPAVAAGLALGHRAIFDQPAAFDEPYPRGSLPQGFVISSASDMTHYLIAHLNGGRYGDASVLSADGIAELHRGAVAAGDAARYAMGWNEGNRFDEVALWHDGDTFGYHSFIALLPNDGWGIVLLANVNDIPAGFRFESIAWRVLGLLLGRPQPPAHVHDSLIVHGSVVGIAVLQLLGLARTAMSIRRWRLVPASRPIGLARLARIVIPFALGAGWALLVFVGLPTALAPLDVLAMAAPDLAWLLFGSAAFAAAWAIIRAALVTKGSEAPLTPLPL